jgi:diguanylate cyclase (GGDEF)-like protein
MSAARIMIADDSSVVRAVLRQQIESQGHTVVEAEDGAAALEQCRHVKPDVLLLDIEMPGLDGHAVLKEMVADPNLADIPVVFLTVRTSTEDIVMGLQLGAYDYLGKPFEPAELIARISAALRVKQLQDELRRRNQELDRISRIDALTGLFNRRHLDDQLAVAGGRALRQGDDLAVIMVDVDHFKRVNDIEGHAAGDDVLKEVSRRLLSGVRVEDVVGRWGGEEFMVMCGRADRLGVGVLAERLRALVEGSQFRIKETNKRLDVTASLGVAFGGGDHPESVVRRADEALYAAKEAGRNRVMIAPPEQDLIKGPGVGYLVAR